MFERFTALNQCDVIAHEITINCPNDNYNLIQFNASDLCTTQAISHTLIGCMLAHHYMENPAGHSRAAAVARLDCKTYANEIVPPTLNCQNCYVSQNFDQ